jgi:hypothetical protein
MHLIFDSVSVVLGYTVFIWTFNSYDILLYFTNQTAFEFLAIYAVLLTMRNFIKKQFPDPREAELLVVQELDALKKRGVLLFDSVGSTETPTPIIDSPSLTTRFLRRFLIQAKIGSNDEFKYRQALFTGYLVYSLVIQLLALSSYSLASATGISHELSGTFLYALATMRAGKGDRLWSLAWSILVPLSLAVLVRDTLLPGRLLVMPVITWYFYGPLMIFTGILLFLVHKLKKISSVYAGCLSIAGYFLIGISMIAR